MADITQHLGFDVSDAIKNLQLLNAAIGTYELLGIEDLVKAKKTHQDKDWPMIRRLVDSHYDQNRDEPNDDRVCFWLRESRTPEVMIRVAAEHPKLLKEILKERPPFVETLEASRTALLHELEKEQLKEKEIDQIYWQPLMKELEAMRLAKRRREAE